MNSILKNWKTTLAGIVPIIGAIYHVADALSNGKPIDFVSVLAMLGIGGGLVAAKDGNVTGGTVQQ